jgi:hypothetical protein
MSKEKTELYYQVTKPDYDEWNNGDYQHATIHIYEVTPDDRVFNDRHYPGEMYVSTHDELCVLSYQRDRTRDSNGNETFDPDKRVVSVWYAEEIYHIPKRCCSIDIDKVERIARLLRKMEKYRDKIYEKGLSIQNGGDDLQCRIFLLKGIGASEVYYSTSDYKLHPEVLV